MEAVEVWKKAKEEIKDKGSSYSLWIEPLQAVSYDGNMINLITPHALAPEIIKTQHNDELKLALKTVCGHDVSFAIRYDVMYADQFNKELKKEIQRQKHAENKESKMMDNLAQMQSSANLNLKYKFSNFVVGENNRMAHAIAMTVAQNPAKKYNPFFIYGASGLGKTHLMQAIGHHIIFNKPNLKVKYIKTEEYVNELINNLRVSGERAKRMDKFRQKYRNIDVLLLDDIQFIEGKISTMEELFHTFDSLHNSSKQIVITSDRLPKDIPNLPERLRTRFEMGIMVDITPPDFETRVAILQNLAETSNTKTDFKVLEYIANNFVNNVRELEGAFNKVSAYADIEKVDLTIEFAQKVLKCENYNHDIMIEDIVRACANYFDFTISDFLSSARNQKLSNARQIAVYLSREITKQGFEEIAEFFQKKHPTMIYSYEKIKKEIKTDKNLKNTINELTKQITEQGN